MKDELGFADKMNGMRKVVVSRTLEEATWNNSTIVRDDVVGAVEELRRGDGGDILVAGSCRLVGTLVEHDLVDELRLMVFPVVLGLGKKLFAGDTEQRSFDLVEARHSGAVALLTLRRNRGE
jgi:dihydrofolate reductase